MTKVTQKVKDRKSPTRRGKPTGAKAGNYNSIIDKINHEDSKLFADCANSLSDMHRHILDMALRKGDYKDVGIKDQWNAIKYCRDIMDKFLDEHYEAAESEGEKSEEKEETEQKANGTTGSVISLISTEYEE